MELSDWTIEYVKARDAMRRSLKDHAIDGDTITFKHAHKTHHFLISPTLSLPSEVSDWYTIVCLNNEENLSFLVDNWDLFNVEKLSVIFVNPKEQSYWQVNPKIHSLIADEKNLAEGLRSLAEQVPVC